MKKLIFSLTIVLTFIIGLGYSNNVSALYIDEPEITSISYVDENAIKLNYKTNNINPDYKVQIFNATLGKSYITKIDTTSYIVKGLEFGKAYNFLIRIYYKNAFDSAASNWSNIVSGTPKASAPVINDIVSDDGTLTLNYKVSGSPKGVQIYLYNTKDAYLINNLNTHTFTGLTNGTKYKFLIRNYYDDEVFGPWSAYKVGIPNKNNEDTPGTNYIAPVITSIKSGNGTLTLNYAVSGSPKGVQIYIFNNEKTYTVNYLKGYTFTGLTNGTKYTFRIRACYEDSVCGPWSGSKEGTPTKPAPTPSASAVVIDKALAWAKRIADDNSYHYGTKHGGTCRLDKKLINCSCFAWKAYEVGAGIKVTKVSDYKYNYWAYGIPTNLNHTKGFKSMGKLSKSKLQPGDILIKKTKPSSSHVEMFWKHSNGTYYTIGSHGHETKSMSKAYSISVKKMTINYTHVYRYVG